MCGAQNHHHFSDSVVVHCIGHSSCRFSAWLAIQIPRSHSERWSATISAMSSGFVSAGTTDEPVERDEDWHKAQQELEDERRRKAEYGQQQDGKSLYEILQQNKSK